MPRHDIAYRAACLRRGLLRAIWCEEAGHSVLEATVAVALLVTVVVPLGSFVVYLASQRHNADQVSALTLGTRYMEETLHTARYEMDEASEEDGRWRVRRDVRYEGGRVDIWVQVFRRGDPQPYVELYTVRLR